MTIQLVRKPPTNKAFTDRLKVTLVGNHTMKQKACMLMQVKFWLQHEQRIGNAGTVDVYIPLIDADGHPLTQFANGTSIADYNVIIQSPYHCAADEHGA
jgi:hypothetical protein